jgi:hypothetical protein
VGARRGRKVINRVDWCPNWVREEEERSLIRVDWCPNWVQEEGERSPIELIGALIGCGKREKGHL